MKKKTFSQVFMLNESYLLIINVQATPTQLYHYVHNASMLVPVATMLNTIPVINTAINWDTLELIFSATQLYDFTISRKGLNILRIYFFMIESENKSVLKIKDSRVLWRIFLKNSGKNISTYRFWDSHTKNK